MPALTSTNQGNKRNPHANAQEPTGTDIMSQTTQVPRTDMLLAFLGGAKCTLLDVAKSRLMRMITPTRTQFRHFCVWSSWSLILDTSKGSRRCQYVTESGLFRVWHLSIKLQVSNPTQPCSVDSALLKQSRGSWSYLTEKWTWSRHSAKVGE